MTTIEAMMTTSLRLMALGTIGLLADPPFIRGAALMLACCCVADLVVDLMRRIDGRTRL